jgi:hypothetical protein
MISKIALMLSILTFFLIFWLQSNTVEKIDLQIKNNLAISEYMNVFWSHDPRVKGIDLLTYDKKNNDRLYIDGRYCSMNSFDQSLFNFNRKSGKFKYGNMELNKDGKEEFDTVIDGTYVFNDYRVEILASAKKWNETFHYVILKLEKFEDNKYLVKVFGDKNQWYSQTACK